MRKDREDHPLAARRSCRAPGPEVHDLATRLAEAALDRDEISVGVIRPLVRRRVEWARCLPRRRDGRRRSLGYSEEAEKGQDTPRFEVPVLLREHDIKSMINVAIARRRPPWGVLDVDSP